MKQAFLFGPFIGSVSWELYRFAPYAIYLRKENPNHTILVYTRPERFDLYGSHADILIPLRINNDNKYFHQNFTLRGLDKSNYNKMIKMFERKYRSHYKINRHFYPDINDKRSTIQWQFSRNKMSYEFFPRAENINLMSDIFKGDNITIDLSGLYMDEAFYFVEKLDKIFDKKIRFICYDPNYSLSEILFTSREIINLNNINYSTSSSLLGCLIIAIKKSKFVISINFSEAVHLSLLLKTLVFMDRDYAIDFSKLINPFNTKIEYLNNYNSQEKFEI